ncbi:MAG: M15 family metallopeptidase [Clostridia bacterium]|nr:M15 family metallopeptidase [Clostridia bacterium]
MAVGLEQIIPFLKPGYTFKGYTKNNYKLAEKDGVTYVVSDYGYTLIANKTYSLPASYTPYAFKGAEPEPDSLLGLTEECRAAFSDLQSGAKKDGVSIWLLSGYRSYNRQKRLYNNYAGRDGYAAADKYSARPGHSEHQTGLAMDVNSLSSSFAGTKEGRWLAANAHKYGFIIRYAKNKEAQTGYIYEPWHIRYVGKDLAAAIYHSGLCLEEFFGITSVYR